MMINCKRKLMAMSAVMLLGACASPSTMTPKVADPELLVEQKKQQLMALEQRVKEEREFLNIGYPILQKNASLCPDKRYSTGVEVWSSHTIGKDLADVAAEAYGVGESLSVSTVLPRSPATKAGIKVGDIIVSMNDVVIPEGQKQLFTYNEQNKVLGASTDFVVLREGQEKRITTQNDQICGYKLVYNANDSVVNAYADGQNIVVTRGMKRFTQTDEELALVISHELAHNVMDHLDKRKQNATGGYVAGTVLDIALAVGGISTGGFFGKVGGGAGASMYGSDFESEADYVGMYIFANAGYDTSNAADFWRRMAAENSSKSIKLETTHPTSAERFLAMGKTHEEISLKRAKGETLEPNIDPDAYNPAKDVYKKEAHTPND